MANKSKTILQCVKVVAKQTGHQQQHVKAICQALFDTIADELKQGNNIAITGFGTFRHVFSYGIYCGRVSKPHKRAFWRASKPLRLEIRELSAARMEAEKTNLHK